MPNSRSFALPAPNTVASEAGGFGYLVWTERQVRLVSMPIRLVKATATGR
jgi:hypothetical protein